MSIADTKIWRSFGLFVGITSTIFLVLLVLLDVLLHKMVIVPVRAMAKTCGTGEPGRHVRTRILV